jgi:GDP-L-fucose synthase
MKKILILGASGFIGKNLANFLSGYRYELYGTYLTNKPKKNLKIKYYKVDLKEKSQVNKIVKNMDVIIQCAAVTGGIKDAKLNPAKYIADNAIMNSIILESIFFNNIKQFVFLSCSVMYESSNKKLKEEDFNPSGNIYPSYFGGAWNKIYIEKMCEYYSRICKTKFTVIRHSNVYGPNDKFDKDKSHLCSATIKKVLDNKSKKIVVWGDGKEKRDLLFIDDLTNAIKLTLTKQKNKYEIFNIGSSVSISVKELVKKIIKISDKKIEINFDLSKPTNKFSLSLNSSKAYHLLKWKTYYSIDQGLKKTINWYKENFQTHQ